MNVFEDLVIELKEANLLEDTVMELASVEEARSTSGISAVEPEAPVSHENSVTDAVDLIASDEMPSLDRYEMAATDDLEIELPVELPETSEIRLKGSNETVSIAKPKNGTEFYTKRATAEVSSLQMVEHILSAVEREYHKKVPASYDDFEAKKALNAFLQAAGDASSEEHKSAEFALMQETEAWCSALARRDRELSVADLRRYCENCRPMLSSQAMLSLARFYRNLPFSEPVRGKFDFIVTRLFSRPIEDQSRKLLFEAAEMRGHIKTLYAEWSSLSLFSVDEPESNIKLAVLSFADLTAEAEKATEFDELIKSDFFSRLRMFKESIADMFYAPEVTVAAIDCNVRIGNVYVELIDLERRRSNAASVHEKYSYLDDDTVSEAAGRTLDLVDVLREQANMPVQVEPEDDFEQDEETYESPVVESRKSETKSSKKRKLPDLGLSNLGVNKWLLASGALLISISVGLYLWANVFVVDPSSTAGVAQFDVASSPFRDDLKIAKISGETFYGVLLPTWETMTKEKQQELLQKIYQHGGQKDWMKVNLLNSQGRTVAFMSASRMDVGNQTPSP